MLTEVIATLAVCADTSIDAFGFSVNTLPASLEVINDTGPQKIA